MRKYVVKPLILLLILIMSYSFLLAIVFFPNPDRLNIHIDAAMIILDEEGDSLLPVFGYTGEIELDGFTDRIMINKARKNCDFSTFENAFLGYERYWHGYLVFLRPLLIFFGYGTIRYLSMFHFTLLMIGVVALIAKKLGLRFALLFGFSLSMCNYIIFPFSLQFSSVFYVMMYAMLFILLFQKQLQKRDGWLICLFLVIGSITNFVDFLTAPLLTLGIPLALCYLLRIKGFPKEMQLSVDANGRSEVSINNNTNYTFKSNLHYLFLGSVFWVIGYFLTWASKWILSYFAGAKDIFETVKAVIGFRIFGGASLEGNYYPLYRTEMLLDNLTTMYPYALIVVCLLVVLLLILLIIRHHEKKERIKNAAPLLFLCAYPYLWYILLANHSQIHPYLTYRIQAISVFVLGAFLLSCIPEGLKVNELYPRWFKAIFLKKRSRDTVN